MDKPTLKIAFSGSSGSGKTTLVKYVHEKYNIPWVSGSAGDLKNTMDGEILKVICGSDPLPDGHREVIRYSAINPVYGITNQLLLQARRSDLLRSDRSFVTDRSPIDNFTYFMNQCGHLEDVTDALCERLFHSCVDALEKLDLLVYVKAVQPRSNGIENNGSRVNNWWWQKSVDAQFEMWLDRIMLKLNQKTDIVPEVVVIDKWDLEYRYELIDGFIENLIKEKRWQA